MARDPRIVVFGEDVADAAARRALAQVKGKGGVFKVTHGLQREFGGDARLQLAARRGQHRRPRVGMATRGSSRSSRSSSSTTSGRR
jgi:2-oxoisovalerate dehydrogenase E1 component